MRNSGAPAATGSPRATDSATSRPAAGAATRTSSASTTPGKVELAGGVHATSSAATAVSDRREQKEDETSLKFMVPLEPRTANRERCAPGRYGAIQ